MKFCSVLSQTYLTLARGLCLLLLSFVLFSAFVPAAQAADLSHAPDDAKVYLISPADGATVSSPVAIKFGLTHMGIAPAGIDQPNTGHHHLLVDLEALPDLTSALPATEQIRHFGGGQTETELLLSPGEHTLQLLLANYTHVPHDHPVLSEPVTVTVAD